MNIHILHLISILLIFEAVIPSFLKAQSLFESSLSESGPAGEAKYQLGGYMRGGVFGDDENILDKYAEGALKLNITGNDFGDAYAEMRYRVSGNSDFSDHIWLREGYVNLYLGRFDFRIGQQIIVWGRADGFNPTNNITPADFTNYSPDEDDRRQSNFVAKATYNFQLLKLEIDWVPFYRATKFSLENATLPMGVDWSENQWPDPTWKNSSIGLKLDYQGAKT